MDEMLVNAYKNTWRHIPKDSIFLSLCNFTRVNYLSDK